VCHFRARAFLVLFLAVRLTEAEGKEVKQIRDKGPLFVGAVGCRSSSCHGGAGEKRSQYLTWSRDDFHARAATILADARSARIAEAVGVPDPQTSARCTVCHSPSQAVPPTRLASPGHPDQGVSCENCHGAAGSWLRGHTRPDWTYAMRVSAGMRDLRNLYQRANACVACHQNIDIDLSRAGHPTLVFELDSQSTDQPRHWKETDPWIGPRNWLTGQAVALREMSWALSQNQPAPRSSELLTRWNGLATLLDKTAFADSEHNLQQLAAQNNFVGVQQHADEIARRAATSTWTPASLRELIARLSSDPPFAAEGAKRLVLALESLTKSLNANSPGTLAIDPELNALREDARTDYNFNVARFADHLRAFHNKL
jgi:cytochrome c554/c'-like protein